MILPKFTSLERPEYRTLLLFKDEVLVAFVHQHVDTGLLDPVTCPTCGAIVEDTDPSLLRPFVVRERERTDTLPLSAATLPKRSWAHLPPCTPLPKAT